MDVYKMDKLIMERTKSSFDISIGTGLAVESIFTPTSDRVDPARIAPIDIDADNYTTHVYNLYTLARNVISAVTGNDKHKLYKHMDVLQAVLDEVYIINSLYESVKATPVFYLPDYTQLLKEYNAVKAPNVKAAYVDYATLQKTLANIHKSVALWVPTATNDKTIMLSHYALDLQLVNKITNLTLLESHTGKIKTKQEFGTKLHPLGKTKFTDFMPFNKITHKILGDKTLVLVETIPNRRKFIQLAIDNKWTTVTTITKVKKDIKKSGMFLEYLK